MYRQEPERGGRPREMLQVGAELLGQGDLAADIEIVRLTIALLRAAGVRDFQINLGHVGVLAPGASPRWTRRSAPKCAAGSTARTAAACAARSRAPAATRPRSPLLPFVIGRRDALDGRARTTRRARPRAGLEHLLALDAALTADERTHVVYDLGEVRGLEYYTGMHFEVFVAGAGRAAGAGGRYDELMGAVRTPHARGRRLARPRHHRGGPAVTRLRVALAKGRLYEPSVERFRAGRGRARGRCGPPAPHPLQRPRRSSSWS